MNVIVTYKSCIKLFYHPGLSIRFTSIKLDPPPSQIKFALGQKFSAN